MPLPIYRLRRLLVATAVLLTATVAGMYFYARSQAKNVLKALPAKIGYDIKQTANGFQISKSDGKRTLFTVQASDVKEFKLNGNAELHNVSILLYGRDSSRFDQIYGDDFAYNQKTGEVTANGDVQIDLVANPAGLASPDQSTPKELKNPIHLRTRDLVFNKDTGNAWTTARVEFSTPQARGSAVGVQYTGKSNTLTLGAQIHIELSGPTGAILDAERGIITNEPREIVLEHPRLARRDGNVQADRATFYLSSENHVSRVLASGSVNTEARRQVVKNSGDTSNGAGETVDMHARANEAEFLLVPDEDLLQTATLSGNVHIDRTGTQAMQGDAGRVILDFAGENQLQKVHAVDGARITQKAESGKTNSGGAAPGAAVVEGPQEFDLTAPVIDFRIAHGRILRHASTSGAARISITQEPAVSTAQPQRTVVTAGKFDAEFTDSGGRNHLASIHGAPDARIVNSTPGQPDRISTSESIDAAFLPQGGIESLLQKGSVAYSDGQGADKRTQAWANSARYTPADQMLALTGSPRVANGGMATTANSIRINRATGDALAEGEVKSTYSELQEQPNGALLASSSPIHVTARSMTAHNAPVLGLYTGNVRLWQDANVVEAPSLQFDRDHRSVTAQGTAAKPVQTILVKAQKPTDSKNATAKAGKSASNAVASIPITITSLKLTYADADRTIHYEGGVNARSSDFTASAKTVNAYLLPHHQASANQSVAEPGQLDHMVAEGNVVIQQQPNRKAEGQKLLYTAADDKFVLTGGPPSIFDAEHGKITGVSLTFFGRDDRVLVEGEASSPVVTTTRVAPELRR
ncbi:MAG TPA: LptA/OstA family protein [Candidatus Sulfotelmatobacter sp.]|nr:LptA/OstA family protein [Candidatus Sulfotelmatobacter sp.]